MNIIQNRVKLAPGVHFDLLSRTWLAPADYFAFPGITIFQSLAQLHASLADLDDAHSSHLDAVREQMASFAVQRREEAAQLLSRVLRPVVSDASGDAGGVCLRAAELLAVVGSSSGRREKYVARDCCGESSQVEVEVHGMDV